MADHEGHPMIRRLAMWLGLLLPDDPERRAETWTVIEEARREIDASRRTREALTDDERRRLAGMNVVVNARRGARR